MKLSRDLQMCRDMDVPMNFTIEDVSDEDYDEFLTVCIYQLNELSFEPKIILILEI